jgi:hypothetical protein
VAEDTDHGRPIGDPAALRAGDEQLRERVLAGRPDGWRLGRALVARRGMAAWIAASTAAARDPARSQPGPCAPAAAAPASVPGAGQIVAVLSEMALAHAA